MIKFIKKIIDWSLIKLRLKKHSVINKLNSPNDLIYQTQSYQRSNLALLLNLACHVSTSNTKFKDSDKVENINNSDNLPSKFKLVIGRAEYSKKKK